MSAAAVLIVEDEAIVAADVARKLKQLGYEVAGTADNGKEAVELALRLNPDLVLMDISLQDPMDGVAAADHIRRAHDIPVVYLTAHGDPATLDRAKLTGPFGYILKPFELRDLATQIEMALLRHQAERQLREQREWFRVTLASIGDAVIATDVDGRISFVNTVAEALTGWSPEQAIGQPVQSVFRVVNEHTGTPLEEPVSRVLREQRAVALANHAALISKNGVTVPIEDSAAPILDAAGRIIGAILVFHDATERRRSEEALRASEERYRGIVETANEGIATHDLEGTITYVNQRMADMLGCSREEIIGQSCLDFVEEGEREAVLAAGDSAIYEGSFVREWKLLRRNGSFLWTLVNVSPRRDRAGKAIGYLAMHTDITERKKTAEVLRASEERLRLIAEAGSIGFFEWNASRDSSYWSPEHYTLFGYEHGSAISYERWLASVHPDDRTFVIQNTAQLLERARSGDEGHAQKSEYRIIRHGITCWLETEATLDIKGGEIIVRGFIRDITTRKLAEQEMARLAEALARERGQLQAIIESLDEAVGVWSSGGDLLLINEAAVRLYGFETKEQMLKHLSEYGDVQVRTLDGRDLPQEEWPPSRVLRGESFTDWELEQFIPSISRRFIGSNSGSPVRDTSGKIVFGVTTVQDITERRMAEEALRRAKEDLEVRVAERTHELAATADQLRALAGELTLTEQRERRRLAKILHDHLQQILVGGKFRLSVLGRGVDELTKKGIKEVEDLIDESIRVSRSLTAELSPPILHEAGLIAGLEWLAKRMADSHGMIVDLNLETIGHLPEQLNSVLFEAARELLFNSFKHAKVLSACVSVLQTDGALRLTVSDEGVGFEPTSLPRAGGSDAGFGLFGIRERLYLLGGTLDIQSAPGRGSRFMITVPIEQAVADELKLKSVSEDIHVEVATAPPPHRTIRLVLADDHAVVRQGLANVLGSEEDIEVVGLAANGREAVDLTARLLPDVVLMDFGMPVLNGVEATRLIRNGYPHVCIIGLSMYEEAERAQAMRDAGASDYLTKSGPIEELVSAIRKAVSTLRKNHSATN